LALPGDEGENPIRRHLRASYVRMGYDRRQWLKEFVDFISPRDVDRVFQMLTPLIQDVCFYDANGNHLDRRSSD